jgi:hypothetical protein
VSQPVQVHYVEGKSDGAETTLRTFMAGLSGLPGLLDACLLASPAQPGLWLLESRWRGPLPELSVPDGFKHWSFEVRASVVGE